MIQVDLTQLFQRTLCSVDSQETLRTCFYHELASIPPSLFQDNGYMRRTKKAALYDIFNHTPQRNMDL